MPPLTVMFKTVSSDCNLNCRYCYYRQSAANQRAKHRLDRVVLEAFLPQYMDYVADAGQAHLSWQGGEPLIAGKLFFQHVVALEARCARPPMIISNVLQTNATLIDKEWADFFARYNFLVGVSLDGPADIHNQERKDIGGRGTFSRVLGGIEFLRAAKVDFNILCVVGPHNVRFAEKIIDFYQSRGFTYLQFMPAMDFQSSKPNLPPRYLINAAEYGDFLKQVFDKWYGNGIPRFSVRIFDNLLQSLLDLESDLCVHAKTCNAGLVIEYNGDVYPCDFYIHPAYKLGNITTQSLKDMAESAVMVSFKERKRNLPAECQSCAWLALCRGECPRNWGLASGRGDASNYFCLSYRELFTYAHERLQKLAARAGNYRRFLIQRANKTSLPTEANAACPCGSGLTFSDCCGLPGLQNCYLFR